MTYNFGGATTFGRRPNNEDAHVINQKVSCGQYAAVFDGHGGVEASQYCAQNIHIKINEELKKKYPVNMAIQRAFCIVDRDYIKKTENSMGMEAGTTALCFISKEGGIIYLGNAGDSRAVLGFSQPFFIDNKYQVKVNQLISQQTEDHKPNVPSEKSRIEQYGSYVSGGDDENDCPRVAGMLAVSRAIGDMQLKPNGVIAFPEIFKIEATKVDVGVMACDGLWDVIKSDEALFIILTVFSKFFNIPIQFEKDIESDEEWQKRSVRLQTLKDATLDILEQKQDDAYSKLTTLSNKQKSEVGRDLKYDKFVFDSPQKPENICEVAAVVLAQMAVYLDSQDNVSVVVLMKENYEKDKQQ